MKFIDSIPDETRKFRKSRVRAHQERIQSELRRKAEYRAKCLATRGTGQPPKPVICLETGFTFASVAGAAKSAKVKASRFSIYMHQGYAIGEKRYHYRLADGTMDGVTLAAPRMRPVVCIETGREFGSAVEAAAWLGEIEGTLLSRRRKSLAMAVYRSVRTDGKRQAGKHHFRHVSVPLQVAA